MVRPRWPGPDASEADRQAWIAQVQAERAKQRRAYERRTAVRRPPRPPFERVGGVCNMCGGDLPGKRRSWCSDACVELWFIATNPSTAYGQLSMLHGHRCWLCDGGGMLDVDHVRPLWSLTDEQRSEIRWWLPFNLQLLCQPCHKAKTAVEARQRAEGRWSPFRGRQEALFDV